MDAELLGLFQERSRFRRLAKRNDRLRRGGVHLPELRLEVAVVRFPGRAQGRDESVFLLQYLHKELGPRIVDPHAAVKQRHLLEAERVDDMPCDELREKRVTRADAEDEARSFGRPRTGAAGEIGNLVLLDDRPRGEHEGAEELAYDRRGLALDREPPDGCHRSRFLVVVVLEDGGESGATFRGHPLDRHLDGVLDDATDRRPLSRQRKLDADGDGLSLGASRRREGRGYQQEDWRGHRFLLVLRIEPSWPAFRQR